MLALIQQKIKSSQNLLSVNSNIPGVWVGMYSFFKFLKLKMNVNRLEFFCKLLNIRK